MGTNYRITCREMTKIEKPSPHQHISMVGIVQGGAVKRYTVTQIRSMMTAGDTFFTESKNGPIAKVVPFDCKTCNFPMIRSAPDATKDNNLDYLPNCL
jgi:hypothetical protein